jgi:restriction system protein
MSKTYWYQDITNPLTGEVVRIKSSDKYILSIKVENKKQTWNNQSKRLNLKIDKEENIKYCFDATKLALSEIENYNNILKYTLDIDDKINWDKLYKNNIFSKIKPDIKDFEKSHGIIGALKFIPAFAKKIDDSKNVSKAEYEKSVLDWEKEENNFIQYQNDFNSSIENQKNNYEKNIDDGVIDYLNLVLEESSYPESLTLNYELFFQKESGLLIIDIDLPNKNSVPKYVEYKYSSLKKEILTKDMKEKELEEFYNNLVYQILLRTIHEILESDYKYHVKIVVVNCWVEGSDSKTGKDFRNCIATLQTTREEFVEINLSKIIPRDCFKHLKGVSAGSLINLSPVKPIMVLNKNDNRIIEASNVLDNFDENSNLASMPWEDFEVLVRDLFGKEFSNENCSVEVTRASRDAGVDAIAFDEDPIKGGKFVIQAKRYNNLVPVSAVRDLYGTVLNEGAVKGILVTTSHYGPDSLEFVKNKPLTLINGEQLLFLFNKHGYKMKIELQKKQFANSYNNY